MARMGQNNFSLFFGLKMDLDLYMSKDGNSLNDEVKNTCLFFNEVKHVQIDSERIKENGQTHFHLHSN